MLLLVLLGGVIAVAWFVGLIVGFVRVLWCLFDWWVGSFSCGAALLWGFLVCVLAGLLFGVIVVWWLVV